ncbi:MAG: hypothetical protein LKJ76_06095 [Lachnospiraceae bacterium]|jgi:predicted PilT family ATPase|nr:hypothetical protein [Lachnospiraceae bacterium]
MISFAHYKVYSNQVTGMTEEELAAPVYGLKDFYLTEADPAEYVFDHELKNLNSETTEAGAEETVTP